MATIETSQQRRCRLLTELQGRRLDQAYLVPQVRADMEAEAYSPDPDKIVTPEMIEHLQKLIAQKQLGLQAPGAATAQPLAASVPGQGVGHFATPELFFSTDAVVIVPGFLASSLSDVAPNGLGLIWISLLDALQNKLGALQLGPYNGSETSLELGVTIAATGALPLVYDLLRLELEMHRYTTEIFPVDWRRNLEIAATWLVARLRTLGAQDWPIHLVAHSQGALVARRALQILGEAEARKLVKHLVLLGPANFGTFSAAFAIAGDHSMIPLVQKLLVTPPEGMQPVLASMSGLYQLLPWNPDLVPSLALPANDLRQPSFWAGHQPIDAKRFSTFLGWGKTIDTSFFDDRTLVLLGDNHGQPTVDGVGFDGSVMFATSNTLKGDGTVTWPCSVLPGAASKVIPKSEHMTLPANTQAIAAVVAALGT